MNILNRLGVVGLAITALLVLVMVGCSNTLPIVKIGMVGPFEGRYREIGYDVIYSARLAVREINSAGGISGYRVALVALDDSGDAELAVAAASSLVIDPQVVAVVGHWLEATTGAAAPVYAEASMPFIRTDGSTYSRTGPMTLSADFRESYRGVSPFDKEPGPYAEPAYIAFQRIIHAMEDAALVDHSIARESVATALSRLTLES